MSEKRNHVMEIEITNKLYSIVKRCIITHLQSPDTFLSAVEVHK